MYHCHCSLKFHLAHCELSGHGGLDKTLAIVKKKFIGPECINGLKTSIQKRRDIHKAPLEKWTDTVPFPFNTVYINHKRPLNPPSNGKHDCLVFVDSFSRFIQVYTVRSTVAVDTIKALETFIKSFGIPQKLV